MYKTNHGLLTSARSQPRRSAGLAWLRNHPAFDHSPRNETVFFVITRLLGLFMGGAAESRLTRLHEGTPGLVWWQDSAVRRKSTPGASAAGPVSRRATLALSHRVDEPPGPQAPPGKQARLDHTDCADRSGRSARMRCPGASALCLSPPLVALLLTRLAIRSGQSHQGVYTEKPLFAFNFWSFAFMCGFRTILHLLVNISHSHIYRPRRSHDDHPEPDETNVTLV